MAAAAATAGRASEVAGGATLGSVVAPSVVGAAGVGIGGAGSVLVVAPGWISAQLRREGEASPSSAATIESIPSNRCDGAFASAFMMVASTIDDSVPDSFDGGSGLLLRIASTSWKPSTPLGHGSTPVSSS